MKAIRQGNDIRILWSILSEGWPYDISGREVVVLLRDGMGREHEAEVKINGNVIDLMYRGRNQTVCGTYSLTLYADKGKDGMLTVDKKDVFRIVPKQDVTISEGTDACTCSQVVVDTVKVSSGVTLAVLPIIEISDISKEAWGEGLVVKNGKLVVDLSAAIATDEEVDEMLGLKENNV